MYSIPDEILIFFLPHADFLCFSDAFGFLSDALCVLTEQQTEMWNEKYRVILLQ